MARKLTIDSAQLTFRNIKASKDKKYNSLITKLFLKNKILEANLSVTRLSS